MVEHEQFSQSPEDAALDRHLLALQRLKPRAGFEDRIMARVQVASAKPVQLQVRASRLVTPRRLWWSSGLAAAGATGWMIALASWFSSAQVDVAGAWLTAQIGEPLVAGAGQAINYGTQMLGFYAQAVYSSVGNAVFPMIAASMLLPVLSSWGLYQTMKQPRGKRVAAYAAR